MWLRWRWLRALGLSSALLVLLSGSAASAADDDGSAAFRIRVGLKDAEPADWSGTISVSAGKVESIRGWRWMPGDNADGNTFKVATRRQQAQSEADRKRVADGGQMPMTDNGLVVTLSGVKRDTEVTLDAKPGKASFRVSEATLGKPVPKLDGSVVIERVPAVSAVADSIADEDYPAVATGKDGSAYVVYLAFTRGKDFQGARERPATAESGPVTGPLATGAVKMIQKPEDLDYLTQPTGGEQIYLRKFSGGKWGAPVAVTDGKNELYRPAVAVDGSGKVWVFYSAHLNADATLDHGNWELMARGFDADGANPGAVVNVSNAAGADFMPAAATDSEGNVWVTWVGGRGNHFNVHVAHQTKEGFTSPKRVSDLDGNEWEPSIAADGKGHLSVAWDTYDKGDYDVYLARRGPDGQMQKPQAVAASSAFEVRPSLAYDPTGQLWVAWEQSGDQWGKDFGPLKKKGIPLYAGGRSIGVRALKEDGTWLAPPDVMDAMPTPNGLARRANAGKNAKNPNAALRNAPGPMNQIAPNFPRLAVDPKGRVWLTFRGKPGGNWRVNVGSVWMEYVTRLDENGWSPASWLPRSNNILDNRPAVAPAGDDGLLVVFSGDGRGEQNPPKMADPHLPGASADEPNNAGVAAGTDDDEVPALADAEPAKPNAGQKPKRQGAGAGARRNAGGDPNDDLFATVISASAFASSGGAPKLEPAAAPVPPGVSDDTQSERKAIQAMHDYRVNLNGETLRVWRGEFHRHTEFSPDGGGDGGLLDMWRYAVDAAGLDWIGDGDHDYGVGREYSWWTTQKAVTLFTLPGKFVPMFSYERSVVYPEGHRNCMFAQRGVRSLPRMPISAIDKEGPAPDTNLLYMYLHRFNGICASHTSATNMGTDWRNNDPVVEPFVEIYQGDRNNYERPDAPRSAVTEAKLKQSTPEKESLGGWRPKGFVNLALLKGYRLAFECSSDHMSTHLSYCNVFVTEPTRQGVIDAIKKRRVYASTDNIVADVRCKTGGTEHFMGEEFTLAEAPTIDIRIIGAQKIAKVTIIKDDEVVFESQPNQQDVKLNWTDPKPTVGKTSYYYVRGEQVKDVEGATSGELVWASPMWIKVQPK